ncbi:MAG: hypothetical protein U0Z26_03990 [Anaerolineales bacterium]
MSLNSKRLRIINSIFLVLSLCFLFAIPALGLASTLTNWHGICYGFTDTQTPCSQWEYAQNEMFWSSFLFIPLFLMTMTGWIILHGIRLIVSKLKNKPAKSA